VGKKRDELVLVFESGRETEREFVPSAAVRSFSFEVSHEF
jgi:hypothetical protein